MDFRWSAYVRHVLEATVLLVTSLLSSSEIPLDARVAGRPEIRCELLVVVT